MTTERPIPSRLEKVAPKRLARKKIVITASAMGATGTEGSSACTELAAASASRLSWMVTRMDSHMVANPVDGESNRAA